MPRLPYLLLFALGVLLFFGCERPLVDERPPDIQVLEPDFSEVITEDRVPIRLKASSFREVTRVEIGPIPLNYNQSRDEWEGMLQFAAGPNIVQVTATDEGNVSRTDTLYAVYMPHEYLSGPALETPVGHHAAVISLLGTVWVFGGATTEDGPALRNIQRLPFGASAFTGPEGSSLTEARRGHTATRLPDGRILLLGGSSVAPVDELSDLVTTAELFDPTAGSFKAVPFSGGNPVGRTLHTALVRTSGSNTFVDVLGGRGNIGTDATPRLGTRSDLRSFLLRGDTLYAQTPNQGPFIEAVAEHTQTPMTGGGTGLIQRYLVRTSAFAGEAREDVSFVLDYSNQNGLYVGPTAVPQFPRRGHAAHYLRQNITVFMGGRAGDPGVAVADQELYLERGNRYIRFPEPLDDVLGPRYGLTATNYGADRILLTGGFDDAGNARTDAVYFQFTLN